MKSLMRVFLVGTLAILFTQPLAGFGQWNKRPYTEWSEKEAMKALNDSPWGQTQTFTDTSRQSSTQTTGTTPTTAIAEVVSVNFRVRLLSSRVTRQAFVRMIELQQKEKLPEQVAARMKAFASADFPDYIVVAVTVDSDKPSNMLQQANSLLYKLTTNELRNNTYLITDDGKRLFLKEYQPPGKDGLGARFIFQRLVDGEPFVSEKGSGISFHTDLNGGSSLDSTITNSAIPNREHVSGTANRTASSFGFTIKTHYKIKDMVFDGKLEY